MAIPMLMALLVAVPAAAQQAAPQPQPQPAMPLPVILPVPQPAGQPILGPAGQPGTKPALPGAVRPRTVTAPGPVSRSAPVNGVVVLYGNERCPTDLSGNEVVVCTRRSAQEQFRVPKELRELQITPENESWAARAQGVADTGVGVSTIGSCSVVGSGGQSGCFAAQARATKRENQARKTEEADANR